MSNQPILTVNNKGESLDDILHHCLHCGLCLPVCPTYNITLQEQSSPRGRIRLIKEVLENKIEVSEQFVDEMYFCLDCQACQTICPAGVHYGSLVEEARNIISEQNKEPALLRATKLFVLSFLRSPWKTKLWATFLRVYQQSGVQDAVQQSGILSLFSEKMHQQQFLIPQISETFFNSDSQEIYKAEGKHRGRVAFLSGCIMNVAFADIHRDAIAVLTKNGYDVIVPKLQQCCGSLHSHNGEIETAKTLAKANIDVFKQYEFDALIIDSAGCGAFMKEYGKVLADDPAYAELANNLSQKTKDITEFLAGIELLPPTRPIAKRVTYHEACHLVHTQKISREPRAILQSIPGIQFVELHEATWCCGSAGIYNVLRYDDSMQMLDRKMNNVASTQADIVVTANPGCHLQIQYGIKKYNLPMEVIHPVTLLRRSYGDYKDSSG